MENSIKKLKKDLNILAAMAENMDEHLRLEPVYGQMSGPHMPKLTFGGYLMREHRLRVFRDELDTAEQTRFANAVDTFQNTMTLWTVRAETKAYREVEARLRQWEETIRDLRRRPDENWNYYQTTVEVRVMLNELLDMLENPPFQYDATYADRLSQLDQGFRSVWRHNLGNFVWDAEWKKAYPPKVFWFLYGQPSRRK